MGTLVSLLFFICSVLGLWVVAGLYPGGVHVQVGSLHLTWPLGPALAVATCTLVGCLYLGQLLEWLAGLTTRLRGVQANHGLGLLTQAWAANLLGQPDVANKLLSQATPKLNLAQQPLADLLKTQTPEEETTLSPLLNQPGIAAPAALRLALLAATLKNWPQVLNATSQGLQHAPGSPLLQALHLKALINTHATPAAVAFLPSLKPTVGAKTWSLLQVAVKTQTAAGASNGGANLNHPWHKTFASWLASSSAKIPEA